MTFTPCHGSVKLLPMLWPLLGGLLLSSRLPCWCQWQGRAKLLGQDLRSLVSPGLRVMF